MVHYNSVDSIGQFDDNTPRRDERNPNEANQDNNANILSEDNMPEMIDVETAIGRVGGTGRL